MYFLSFFYYNSKSYQDINLKLGMYNQGYNISDTCRQFLIIIKIKKLCMLKDKLLIFQNFEIKKSKF